LFETVDELSALLSEAMDMHAAEPLPLRESLSDVMMDGSWLSAPNFTHRHVQLVSSLR